MYRHVLMISCVLLLISSASALAGDQWHLVNASPGWEARENPLLTVYDGKLWLVGGDIVRYIPPATTSADYLNDVWYTEDGNIWHLANDSAAFSKRYGAHLVTFDNKMWLIGGYDIDYNAPVDVWYSTEGEMWYLANASATPVPRDEYGVVVYDGKIWIVGGYDWDSGLLVTDIWTSTDGFIWTEVTPDATYIPRVSYPALSTIVFDGKLWVTGGEDWDIEAQYFNAMSTTDGITWIVTPPDLVPFDLGNNINSFSKYDAGTKVYAHKGTVGVMYSTDMDTWSIINETPQFNTVDYTNFGVYTYIPTNTGMIEYNGKLWLMGGYLHNSSFFYGFKMLNGTWYTDNLTPPEPTLPYCSWGLSTTSIVTSASAGILLLITGLIVIAGFFLVNLLNKGWYE